MDAGNAPRAPIAQQPVGLAPGPASKQQQGGGGGNRRLTNMEQQILAEDNNAAAGAAGFYGARNMGMYGAAAPLGVPGLGNPGLRGVPGLMQGQFGEDPNGLASLQGAAGLGGLQAMNGLGQNLQAQQAQQQAAAAQQRAMAAQQVGGGVDFQGLMPTGFDGSDASAALLGNPAAMAGYPFQGGFNAAVGLGVDGNAAQAGAGLLNANAAAMGGAANMAAARNAQFGNPAGGGMPMGTPFDQGYHFARSEMALLRQQAAYTNNAALLGAGGAQGGFNLAGFDRQGAAGLRGLAPAGVNPYANYGGDPNYAAAAGQGNDPYGRGGPDGGQPHLATIPAIRLAQHRNTLQQRMMVNNLPERKDGSFPVVLYQESDEHKLTAYQCLLRKQLELFEADEDDVRCSTRQGRTAPIKLGQVGLRCRHCAGVQLAARTKGAAYYSQTIEGIYQIAQNMSKVHLCERCYRIPRDVRRQLIVLRSDCRRAIGGKEYWSENIRALGVYVDGNILRVKKAPKEESKDESKEESKDESKEADGENGKKTEAETDIKAKEGGESESKDDQEMKVKEKQDGAAAAPKSAEDVEESKMDESENKTAESSEESKLADSKNEAEASPMDEEKIEENAPMEESKEKDEEKPSEEGEKMEEDKPIENGDSASDVKEENEEDAKEGEDAKKEDAITEEVKKDDEIMEEVIEDEAKAESEAEEKKEEATATKEDTPENDSNSMEVGSDPVPADSEDKTEEGIKDETTPLEIKASEEDKGTEEKGKEEVGNGEQEEVVSI